MARKLNMTFFAAMAAGSLGLIAVSTAEAGSYRNGSYQNGYGQNGYGQNGYNGNGYNGNGYSSNGVQVEGALNGRVVAIELPNAVSAK